MLFPNIDPVALEIGNFQIHWYALAYMFGFIFCSIYITSVLNRPNLLNTKFAPDPEKMEGFMTWVVIGVILGGRLGYVLFYQPLYYLNHPLEILSIWQGGMSFHGGLVGVILVLILFCKIHKINFLAIADIIGGCVTFGLLLGRIANFINAELWGRTTTVPWGIIFPNAGPLPRHPSQLYEALLEGLLLFIILNYLIFYRHALKQPGLISSLMIAGYAITRIFCEFFRVPDAHIGYFSGNTTMGIWLSVPLLLLSITFYKVGKNSLER